MGPSILENEAIRRAAINVSVEQYHRFHEAGLVDRTELIEGVIVEKMPKSPEHVFVVQKLLKIFSQINSAFFVRVEQPLSLAGSEPEPDISIVKGSPEDFITAHPSQAELVIEVSQSSLAIDREKANIYARAGIAQYWIFNLTERVIEIHKGPLANGYSQLSKVTSKDSLSFKEIEIPLTEILI